MKTRFACSRPFTWCWRGCGLRTVRLLPCFRRKWEGSRPVLTDYSHKIYHPFWIPQQTQPKTSKYIIYSCIILRSHHMNWLKNFLHGTICSATVILIHWGQYFAFLCIYLGHRGPVQLLELLAESTYFGSNQEVRTHSVSITLLHDSPTIWSNHVWTTGPATSWAQNFLRTFFSSLRHTFESSFTLSTWNASTNSLTYPHDKLLTHLMIYPRFSLKCDKKCSDCTLPPTMYGG